MKVYQLSKKLLNRLAKELDAEIYRLGYREYWTPTHGEQSNVEYVLVNQMDYQYTIKYPDVKLVLKNGKTLHFNLGQQLMVLGEYVDPETFVNRYVNPLFDEEN